MASPRLLVLAGLAVGAQVYGLYVPSDGIRPPGFPGADKVQHVLGFAVPVALVVIAGAGLGRPSRRWWRVTALVFAVHAVVSELIQGAFYHYRTGDPYDVLADAVGIGLGLLLARAGLGLRAGREGG